MSQPLAKDRAKLFLIMSSALVTKFQLLFVVIMDLEKKIADTMKTLESFVVSVKTHRVEFKKKYKANTFLILKEAKEKVN